MQNRIDTATDTECLPQGPSQLLGLTLSARRESLDMSLSQISRITKIPAASLRMLEAGRFGELPGDVFVRGFLRSYARCLKIDGDEIVSRYAKCGLCPAPVSSELADAILGEKAFDSARPRRFPKATQNAPLAEDSNSETEAKTEDVVRSVLRDAFDLRNWRPASKEPLKGERDTVVVEEAEPLSTAPLGATPRTRSFVPPQLVFNDDMSHRGPLTLGVIILVIVATLTMSFLLRRPGSSVDGFTMAPAAGEQIDTAFSDTASSVATSPFVAV